MSLEVHMQGARRLDFLYWNPEVNAQVVDLAQGGLQVKE